MRIGRLSVTGEANNFQHIVPRLRILPVRKENESFDESQESFSMFTVRHIDYAIELLIVNIEWKRR
jgi:hypothetical protein